MPSHIIAPAVHVTTAQIEADFRRVHKHARPGARPVRAGELLGEARAVLRERFLAADVGITGANFLVAETGTSIIVTNEGNGDLTQILPKTHIVLASIEKLVPTLEDVGAAPARACALGDRAGHVGLHDALDRPAPRRAIPTAPSDYHVVILDNGRSAMLGTEFAGHAALHPLRRLHEPLPGISSGRRSCLWLGLSRARWARCSHQR